MILLSRPWHTVCSIFAPSNGREQPHRSLHPQKWPWQWFSYVSKAWVFFLKNYLPASVLATRRRRQASLLRASPSSMWAANSDSSATWSSHHHRSISSSTWKTPNRMLTLGLIPSGGVLLAVFTAAANLASAPCWSKTCCSMNNHVLEEYMLWMNESLLHFFVLTFYTVSHIKCLFQFATCPYLYSPWVANRLERDELSNVS